MRDPLFLTAFLLLAVLSRSACHPRPAPVDFLEIYGDTPTLIPNLATDGVERLSWLPGVGVGRARKIVKERPFFAVPLGAERLTELPGVGAQTAAEAGAWLEAQRRANRTARRE